MKKWTKSAAIGIAAALMLSGMTVSAQAHVTKEERAAAIAEYKLAKAEFQAAMAEYKATKMAGQAEFKAAMDAWKLANADLIAAIKAVKEAFHTTMDAAKAARDLVLNDVNATAEQIAAANATFAEAKLQAVASRDAALAALGTLPPPPAKPA
ncbi:MAG: hypothetical protein RIS75_522, partial [Actinomycetota bacterium]